MAIIAALIGACAVVGGVILAQWLVIRHNQKVERRALAQSLKNGLPNLLKGDVGAESVGFLDTLNQIEGACSHMARSRRTKVLALLDEYAAMVVNVPGRVTRASGILPDDEREGLTRWTMLVVLAVSERRTVDPDELSARLTFYATEGLAGRRPGAPSFEVPTSGFVSRFRRDER